MSVALPGHARAGRGRGAHVDAVACEAGARGQLRSARGAVAADDLGKEKMRAEKKLKREVKRPLVREDLNVLQTSDPGG